MATGSVKDHRALMERLTALGWVCTGWEPVSGSWRFRENQMSGKTHYIKSGSEVEAIREFIKQREEMRQDEHPATTQ